MSIIAGGGSPTMMRLADGIAKTTGVVSEDGGQFSSMRLSLVAVIGFVLYSKVASGAPMNWIDVTLVGITLVAKVVQKYIEKPQQGVVDAREAKRLVDEAVRTALREAGR